MLGMFLGQTRAALVLTVSLAGCGPAVDAPVDAGGSSTTTGDSPDDDGPPAPPTASTSPTFPTTDTTSPSTSGSTGTTSDDTWTTGSGESSDDSNGSGAFLIDPDGGWCLGGPSGTLAHCSECSVWEQDCPQWEKCSAWANDGSGVWNAPRCVALEPDPDLVGQPCVAEGSGSSGIDSCERGAMCWNLNPETLVGTCVALCSAPEHTPSCDDPAASCVVSNDGVLNLCLPSCDPMQQDCVDGHGCYPYDNTFACVREGDPVVVDGNPHPQCPAGSFATGDDIVPNCDDEFCCTTFCDLAEPACPETQECADLFEAGSEWNPGDVGGCSGPL